MDTARFLLLISLGLVLTMIYTAWLKDYGPSGQTTSSSLETPALQSDSVPFAEAPALDIEESGIPLPASKTEGSEGEKIRVTTDVLDIEINTRGGTIEYAALKQYPVTKKNPTKKIMLLHRKSSDFFYVVQGGVLSKGNAITPETYFYVEKTNYAIENEDSITVPLYFNSEDGIKVTKNITFYKGQYVADIDYEINNQSQDNWTGRAYGEINRTKQKEQESRLLYTYTGAVISTPKNRYEKISFDDIDDEEEKVLADNGWAAMLQHYFLTALIPKEKEETYTYYTRKGSSKNYIVGAALPTKNIAPGETIGFSHRAYFGPKTQKEIEKIAEGLSLTVDYGIFWFIAKPLYWLLDYINTFTKNWGWSIVLVTVFLKLLFYKLSAAGYRSMANMRRVQPRLIAIKERHKDDRAQLNKAMMDIYKKEKINPLGGCFPILVQIPVFISLYWVLLESVELRQAEFILWIDDLSIADPFFVLPLLMGITMFLQQKLNPAPMDPIQAKVMAVLPVVFTVFFAFFPAGLVLYWVANNVLSIVQQWAITRSIEKNTS